MGTPENFNGKQPADFGVGYAGLYLYAPEDYREYLQVPLLKPLIAGKTYQLSFYVSLAERSDFAVKEFGILFSNNEINVDTKKELSKKIRYQIKGNEYSYMEIGYSNFYADTKDWILVHTEFEAKGTEQYLIIGNFKNNTRTRLFRTRRTAKKGAYYYLDEVTLKAVEEIGGSFEKNKTHTFKNLLFAFDKSDLANSSKSEIDKIFNFLKDNEELSITINGHTDTIGGEKYNQILATKRAKAVADHLMQMGLPEQRVLWFGHGGDKPIADNSTKSGRNKNRRVEFVISD